ncbi:MAG: hypothetical protein JNK44_01125 [Cyclobacteriaceae bacterium]|nr:hypothetical protein [Cyclobacteriaceae bacterium]
MKTLNFISTLLIVGLIWGCDTKEKQMLLSKVDSLQVELSTSLKNVQTLQEIGSLIDSIDASREMLRTNVVEGTSYANYKGRLDEINVYIRETRSKIEELENSLKKNSAQYAATVKRLKNELEQSSLQVAALQTEIEKFRTENSTLTTSLQEKETVLVAQNETIKLKDENIASLETKISEINQLSKTSQAELYFAQARALETAADRTKFAPKKKKETQREALELYRMSYSLGNQEAQSRIAELEKDLG